jgi:16S rRNA (guanine966-N2)-methyltransferase
MGKSVQARKRPRTLRIIGGEWRGRRLTFPDGTAVRPTPDRVRETLFNWLQPQLRGARCLDLFAGSGILGFEALSRGARDVCFVESNRSLADALGEHAKLLGGTVRIAHENAERFVNRSADAPFDVVFLDPPYSLALEPFLARLPGLVSAGGCVYIERPAREGLPATETIKWQKTGRAGAVCFGLAQLPRP